MNCKPGDLAIVISAPAFPHLIGRVIKVTSLVVDVPRFSNCWETEPQGFIGKHCLVYDDEYLRPVSGLPDTEDTDTEQPIKEVA